jgi:hypothetical protein
MLALYFSGVPWLQNLASPAHQREFGLIENLQNLFILGMVILCLRTARIETGTLWRILWFGAAIMAIGILMEEIDWGNHYYTALTGKSLTEKENFNIHNQSALTDWLKRGVDLTFLFGFVVLPLFANRFPPKIRLFIPLLYSALPLLIGFGVSQGAHAMEDAGWPNNQSLNKNISEFREMFTYWVVLLYLWEVSRRRIASPSPKDGESPGA